MSGVLIFPPEWWEFANEPGQQFSGYASTLPVDHVRDLVAELRAVVEEVTGSPVEDAPKRRIGFVQ